MKAFLTIALAALLLAPVAAHAQRSRIATDFEIAQMEQQLARSRDFTSQVSGRLNLGDARAVRSETDLAREQYRTALQLASAERTASRRDGQLTRYTTATSYAALASAKLGRRSEAFAFAEESLRYESGSAKSWNLAASAMSILGMYAKSAAAARNAVEIATADLAADPSVANRLDLAVYQYALASALAESGDRDRAIATLRAVTTALDAREFAALRKDVAEQESFEIYSSARGDAATWLSLVNRANLRLGALLERSGDATGARARYERVLAARSDDATALAALARMSTGESDRERYFAGAFDANPFSMSLIREYQRAIETRAPASIDDTTTGGKMRRALATMKSDRRAARRILEELQREFPQNRTIATLIAETAAPQASLAFLDGTAREATVTAQELESVLDLLAADKLTAAQRAALDTVSLTTTVTFPAAVSGSGEGTTSFAAGTAGTVHFRFPDSTSFRGSFPPNVPLRLTFHILGATKADGADALLLEPLRLEVIQ